MSSSSSGPHYNPTDAKDYIIPGPTEKETIIKPRGFSIVWGNDTRYWRLPAPRDRDAPAELLQVSWLEVTCSAPVKAGKKYEISFKVSWTTDAFGWNGCPVFMMAKIGKRGKYSWKKITINQSQEMQYMPKADDKFIISGPTGSDDQLYFGLYEVWSGKWKGGLLIHEAIITEA